MKKSIFVFCFFFGFVNMNAQDYIKPIEGKGFYAKVTKEDSDEIFYESNRTKFTIPKKEVILIEYLERGVVIYNKEYIKELDVSNYRGFLYAEGNSVYIPFHSNKSAQRGGAIELRKLLAGDGFWKVVDCEQEAHFIMEYVFDEYSGLDKAYFRIKNRNGKILYTSEKVRAKDFVPYHAGQKSATKLYEKHIKKLQKNIEK